jgi:hypothetical protein
MNHKAIIRYTVKAEYASQNKANISRVMDELRALKRTDIWYSTFVEDDGKSFIHIVHFANEEAKKTLELLESFKLFQFELKSSGPEVPPLLTHLTLVGSTHDFP